MGLGANLAPGERRKMRSPRPSRARASFWAAFHGFHPGLFSSCPSGTGTCGAADHLRRGQPLAIRSHGVGCFSREEVYAENYCSEERKKAMAMKNPPHPGDFIRTEIVEPAGLTVTAAAEALGVSRPTLSSLLNGKAGLSGDRSLRIEKAFGVKMDTLMRMWSAYEIAQTRKREKLIRVQRVERAA